MPPWLIERVVWAAQRGWFMMRSLFALFLVAVLGGTAQATVPPPVFLYVDVNAVSPSGDCTQQNPCSRITDGLAEARRRYEESPGVRIVLQAAAGTYRGTQWPTDDLTLEAYPLVFNIPGLVFRGAGRMTLDAQRRPLAPDPASPQTRLETDDDEFEACFYQAAPVIAVTRARSRADGPDAPFTGGDGTVIEGVTIVDNTFGSYSGILVDRVVGVTIRQVYSESATSGVAFTLASGLVSQTFVTGAFHGMDVGSGNTAHPAAVVFDHVRAVDNGASGLNLYAASATFGSPILPGASQDDALEIEPECDDPLGAACAPVPDPECVEDAHTLVAWVHDSDLEGGGVGLRLWLVDGPGFTPSPGSTRSKATVLVTNNDLVAQRNYPLDVNAGFVFRQVAGVTLPDQSVDLDLVLYGNRLQGGRAPALFSFQAIQQLLRNQPYDSEKTLVNSTYRIYDVDHELTRYDWSVPDCAPETAYGSPQFRVGADGTLDYPFTNCLQPDAPRLYDALWMNGAPTGRVGAHISGPP